MSPGRVSRRPLRCLLPLELTLSRQPIARGLSCRLQVLQERLTRYEDLLQTAQTQDEDDAAVHGVFAAHSEAETWRADRKARLLSAGVPEQRADVFLDAAVGEYIALAHGMVGRLGGR